MNARYKIHPDEGYVESWIEGSVTLPEMWSHVQQVWADPDWKAELNGIMDLSKAEVEITEAELRTLAGSMLADPRRSLERWVFVVSTAATFAMLRRFDVLTEDQAEMRIFFSRADAEKWFFQRSKRKA